MQRDSLNNPTSVQRDATLRGIDDFIQGYLSYETRAERILAAADADPESCLANVYAGLLWMLLEAPAGARNAARYLSAAERAAPGATRREQLNAAMLRAWVDDDGAKTLRLCEQITDEFPRDLVVVKTHQYLEFNRGNSPQMLRVALKVATSSADVPYMHGMTAFAYQQCHLLDEAESEARVALDMQSKEPWAQHALAHVFLTRGLIDAGAAFFEQAAETWIGLNSFRATHNWRHLATSVPRIAEIGGSHAQRDLFELILVDTAVKDGRLTTAQRVEQRRVSDPHGVPVNTALAAVYARIGLRDLAAEAHECAVRTRARHRA